MVIVIGLLALIASILLFGRWSVLATIFFAVVWGLSNFAHAEVTGSFTTAPVTVMCPNPGMTAYLESPEAPPRFSKEWEYTGGHAHCRTVKNDRPLIVLKTESFAFHGREYAMAELMPGGVIVSVDGFGGPYYLLTSRIKKLPTAEQMRANAAAFLPTAVDYGVKPVAPSEPDPTPPPAVVAPIQPPNQSDAAPAI